MVEKKLRTGLGIIVLVLLVFVSLSPKAYAYTNSGTIPTDEAWSGQIEIVASVTVPSGVTLQINPGTVIRFADGAGLTVNGRLVVAGTDSNQITFTSASASLAPGKWAGVTFNDASLDTSIIEHAVIEYGGNGIICNSANPTIKNCVFRRNSTGISLNGSDPSISGCTFADNAVQGLYLQNYSNPEIANCIITGNASYGVFLYYSSPRITNSHFAQNGTGIYVNSSSPDIRNCIIRDHSYGIYAYQNGRPIIEFNTFVSNGYAISLYHYDSNTCTVKNNIITQNNYGIYRGSGGYELGHNDVWGNTANYTSVVAGTTDLSTDPMYVDFMGENFALREYSPMLTAGPGGTQIGAYGGGNPPFFNLVFSTIPTTAGSPKQNERWSGEIQITADVTVPQNIILKIDPGTIIRFADGKGIYIDGKIFVLGTSDAPIIFTSASASPSAGRWTGIAFNNASLDTSNVEHTLIEYAGTGIICNSANPSINDCLFRNNNTAISLNSSDSRISGCSITSNTAQGLYLQGNSNPEIDNCVISGNANYGVFLYYSSPRITNSHLAQNGTGIYANSSSPDIRNNIIRDHSYGIYTYQNSRPTIEFNTFVSNGYAISLYHYDSNVCTLTSNIVTENNYGIYRGSGGYSLGYNDVWGNSANYSNLGPDVSSISVDPCFVSVNDLHLQPGSPCIDVADPYVLDDDGTRADMGAYGGKGGYNGDPDNLLPDRPANLSPTDGSGGFPLHLELTAGAFSDPDETDFQMAAQWQIRGENGDYLGPIFDSSEDRTNLVRISIPCGKLQAGSTYFWRVRYKDNKNAWSVYSEETSFATALDSIPPEASITAGPTEEGLTGQTVNFTWSGIDDSGCPPICSYRMDNEQWSGFSSMASWTFTGLTHGAHVFAVRAKDGSDNIDATPATRNFNVDALPPAISNIAVPANEIVGTSVRILWATDEPSVSRLEYWTDTGPHGWASHETLKTQHDLKLTGLLPNKTYTAVIHCRDAFGNESSNSDQPVSFTTFDDVPPEEVSNITAQSFDSRLVFEWNHSPDSYGDLAGYRVYFDGSTEPVRLDKAVDSYESTDLSPATFYGFKITAFDTTGNESHGVSISASTLMPNPAGLSAVPYSGYVTLSWTSVNPSQCVKHYAVYVGSSQFSSVDGLVPQLITTASSARIAGLSNNVTYYFAVTTVNISNGEKKEVSAVSATPVPDREGPDLSNTQLNGAVLINGTTLGGTGVFALTAADPSGISRLEFYIDGVLCYTDTNGSSSYSFTLDILPLADGNHTLTITAYDTLENTTSVNYSFLVALDPPASPSITGPANGAVVNKTAVTIAGQAPRNTQVTLYANGMQTGAWVPVDTNGNFSIPLSLSEGANRIQAAARNRGGVSPLSAEIQVTVDTSIPESPTHLSAEAKPGGVIRLSWTKSTSTSVRGYLLYRSAGVFSTPQEAIQVNTSLITGTMFDDIPPGDGIYYYRVSAMTHAGNESGLSNSAFATSDRIAPYAVSIQYSHNGRYDPLSGRMAPGTVNLRVRMNELLQSAPFLSITPEGGMPVIVELIKASDFEYTGFFVISNTTSTGTAYAVFSARDIAGNRGTDINSGRTIQIDTSGPMVTHLNIHPDQPVKNNQADPVRITAVIGLSEPVKPASIPEISYLLSGQGRTAMPVESISVTESLPGHAQTWQASFVLPADAGLTEAETLSFTYKGMDNLDNMSERILCDNRFQVYQGDLPPLDAPQELKGESLPGGLIRLSWNKVDGAVGYQLYRKSPAEVELTAYQRLGDVHEYSEDPGEDGIYVYAVASVRSENGQEGVSGTSASVQLESDSIPPGAPCDLKLELIPQGIKATWNAASPTEEITYTLYRANQDEILSTLGLEPIIEEIQNTYATDGSPSVTDHCYVVTAVDRAGNESIPSNFFYLNFSLLPVSSLNVRHEMGTAPVVSWTHPGGDINGYNITLTLQGQTVRLNDAPLSVLYYTDTGYVESDRTYTVTAVDGHGAESLGRSVILPLLDASLLDGEQIKRGIMNRLEYRIQSLSSSRVENVRLKVQIIGLNHVSELFGIDPGETKIISVTVPGYAELNDLENLTTTISITPHAGELVEIVEDSKIEISDGMLSLQILNEEFTRGSLGKVRFTLQNTSDEEVEIVTASGSGDSDEVSFYLLDPDGNVLSSKAYKQTIGTNILNLSCGRTVVRVPAGASFTSEPVELQIPSSAPDDITVELDIANIYFRLCKPEQAAMDGLSTRRRILLVDTSYYGEVTGITPQSSTGNEDITIKGRAVERATGLPLPGVYLNLVVSVSGFERIYKVFTGQDGAFAFTFKPLPGESGLYKVSVLHPDLLDRPVHGEFLITRVAVSPGTIDLSIPRNYEQSINIGVSTGDGTEIHNVHLLYNEADQPEGVFPEGVHLTLGPPVAMLGSKQSTSLGLTIWADNSAEETGTIVLRVKSDESAENSWGTVTINVKLSDARPALFVVPDHIETGLNWNEIVTEGITLENRGMADMEEVTLAVVSQDGRPAPSWVSLISEPVQGMIAVGEKREISVLLSPSSSVPEGTYTFYLQVTSSNSETANIGLYVSVTQSGIGNMLFKVSDLYTGTLDKNTGQAIQGLAGARITVQNEMVLNIGQALTTDSLGEALFSDLPAGRYKCRITSDNHQEYIGRFWIKPGITGNTDVFLNYNLVTVEWAVLPTIIEDRYEVTLKMTYETEVPAPVVVTSPSSVTLPEMRSGDVYRGEFTLTNHGLINAENVQLILPPDDSFFKYEFLTKVPEVLLAKQVVTVPYRVTCLATPGTEANSSGGGEGSYITCVNIPYTYEAECGQKGSGTATYCITYPGSGQSTFTPPIFGGGGGSGGASTIGGSGPGGSYGGGSPSPSPQQIEGIYCPEELPPPCDPDDPCCSADSSEQVNSIVDLITGEYKDEVLDISVKVPGGYINMERLYYKSGWHWSHDSRLEFKPETECSSGIDLDGKPSRSVCEVYLKSIIKDGAEYVTTNKYAPDPVLTNRTAKITAYGFHPVSSIDFNPHLLSGTGCRWEDKQANWKEYDENGQIQSYGNRSGMIGEYLYADGRISGISDRNDRQVIWFEYNSDGMLAGLRDISGRTVRYSYESGRLSRAVDVAGNETKYSYGGSGELVSKTNARGIVTNISYNGRFVKRVTDQNGIGKSFDYFYDDGKYYAMVGFPGGKVKEAWFDRKGNRIRTDINGRTVETVIINEEKRTKTVEDAAGNRTVKTYDDKANLSGQINPDGTSVRYQYDSYSNLVEKTDERDVITRYEYDDTGNLLRQVEAAGTALGRITEYTYDSDGNQLTIKKGGDSNTQEATMRMEYDAMGNIVSITDPEGNTTRLTYDVMGNVLTKETPNGAVTYEYDVLGRLTSTTDPLGSTTQTAYDEVGNKIKEFDPLGRITSYEYDQENRLIRITDAAGGSKHFGYNAAGKLIKEIDAEGKETNYEYDIDDRLVRQIDGNGNVIAYEYGDVSGSSCQSCSGTGDQPTAIIYPTFVKRFKYDSRGRRIAETDIVSESETYTTRSSLDGAGNLLEQVDKEGRVTRYQYDVFGRLEKVIDALNNATEYAYDGRDNLVALRDANGNVTRFEYDRNNRLIKEIRPMGQEKSYKYDPAGNFVEKTDAKGQKTRYVHDDAGRNITIEYYAPSDETNPVKTVNLAHDKKGTLVSYDDGRTSAQYAYDDLGRKTSETVNYGPFSVTYSYTYYKNGKKRSFTEPDGTTYEYTYDNANQLKNLLIPGQGSITYGSYIWNKPGFVTLPGGSTNQYSYDPLSRIKSILVKDPAQNTVMDYRYEYDGMDNITAKQTEHGNYTYSYDGLYRLVAADNPTLPDETYTYDPVGNRLSCNTTAYSYNPNNELLNYGGTICTYDDNGSLIQKSSNVQSTNYVYNNENRLIRVEDEGGDLIAQYYYDLFGRRLWKEVDGAKTYFFYSDEGIIGEYDSGGTEIRTYGYKPDSTWTTDPLFTKQSGQYYFYHNDHLGTPMHMTALNGATVWAAKYKAFGEARIDTRSVLTNNLRFPGQYFDQETVLHYNWHRDYDSYTGRYVQTDPIGMQDGPNLFLYARNDPLGYIDADGQKCEPCDPLAYWTCLVVCDAICGIATHHNPYILYLCAMSCHVACHHLACHY